MTDDARMLEAVARGDRVAFERFVRRHEAAVLRYARSQTPDEERAADALQETFIAAWRSAGTFRGPDSARGWLLAIARNAVRRQYRRPAGAPERFEPLAAAAQAGWGREPGEAWTARIAARELVERGFEALSPEDRELLLLRDLEGFRNEDVAGILGLSVPAVKSRLHRARMRFMATVREIDERA